MPRSTPPATSSGSRVLLVADAGGVVAAVERLLRSAGYAPPAVEPDPLLAAGRIAAGEADLVLADLARGTGLLERLGPMLAALPVIALAGTASAAFEALALGARDVVRHPLDGTELLLRVRNHLAAQHVQRGLEATLTDARHELLQRLAAVAEHRDETTTEHTRRVGRTAAAIGRALGLPAAQVAILEQAAQLHDIGKIGIPDAILLKPGPLAPDERRTMREHGAIGARILAASRSPVLRVAERIALTHHERWDGRGYPAGLAGEAIPLFGRITAVADVFDALTHARPYKPAWPVPAAVAEVVAGRGTQFDPAVVDAFATLAHGALAGGQCVPALAA